MIPSSTYCLSHPNTLALSPKTVKKFLKIDHEEDDEIIIALIKSVTTQCQNYTSLALINQSWQASYRRVIKSKFQLPIKPALEIDKVYLINHREKKSLYPKEFYFLDTETSEIEFYIQPISSKVRIEYKCGFGESFESIPQDLQTAMLQHISYIYNHRGDGRDFDFSVYSSFKPIRI